MSGMPPVDPRVAEVLGSLAHSVRELALAVRQLSATQEIMQEGMKVATEAQILGVSPRTVRRRREKRRNERLIVI